jgi:glycosyltransferase involved in cell wall biosynthesis
MNVVPDISVVMGVHNGGSSLPATIESILSQEDVSLEFVIVNDGSTDQTSDILADYSDRDPRVRVIHQQNYGLTKSLIRGCAAARGTYIARQDAGDVSLPNRLARQLDFIKQNPGSAFVSCGTRFVGPSGEYLYEVTGYPDQAVGPLYDPEKTTVRGPSHHASTIFSRSLYQRIGGYRPEFYFAQDLDLWLRLSECGTHLVMPEVLYQAAVSVGSISGLFRNEQIKTTSLIIQSALRRLEQQDDKDLLIKAAQIQPDFTKRASRLRKARALYFIGSCLRKTKNPSAPAYFRDALQTFPLHLRSAMRLLFG